MDIYGNRTLSLEKKNQVIIINLETIKEVLKSYYISFYNKIFGKREGNRRKPSGVIKFKRKLKI